MQTILETYDTRHAARSAMVALRSQGIHAWMAHDIPDVDSGTAYLEAMRQTKRVAWVWVFECPDHDERDN
jgi:hypothetical protein